MSELAIAGINWGAMSHSELVRELTRGLAERDRRQAELSAAAPPPPAARRRSKCEDESGGGAA